MRAFRNPIAPAAWPIPKIDDPRVLAIVNEFNARPMRRETDIRILGWSAVYPQTERTTT